MKSIAVVLLFAACACAARIPPSANNAALMARFILNEAEWTTIATISTDKDIEGLPFANLKSVADGAIGKGNGVPYIFLTPLDYSAKDVAADPRATMMMSLAQGDYCEEKGYDPMDPRCGRVIFSGKVKKIAEDDAEYETAKAAVFGRHPWLTNMPPNHSFYFAKLDIETITVIAKFGGAAHPTVAEYFGADEGLLESYSALYR